MASFHSNKINPDRFSFGQWKFFLFLVSLSVFMILPIIFIFSQALKPVDELFLYPPKLFVQHPTWSNFATLFSVGDVSAVPKTKYLFNSILVTGSVVFLSIVICSMTGFALSKKEFKMKKVVFEVNIIALMFVPAAVTIPRYLVIEKLGLTDNFLGHILPMLSLPVGVFLVKQFVDQIPNALIEAAQLDGANDYYVFRKLVIPMIMPALATVAILSFQLAWNNAETSSLFMSKETLKTFAFYMSTLTTTTAMENNIAGQGMAAAAALLMFIPNLAIFIFMQSKVMDTMAHSGLK
ncbi:MULTISPECIES: carbohydrate ABC transporter permease [Paenibacillus]|uniref:Carbohydrate ABC transporter permease n=1 Tax=Paenibacillus lignilyticus TaxID=1172615 RepID=A0ABS5CC83_9BACL|nr:MULTISPECIES: carbohydrate ABC transporter permease [Paenibacillus]MBP3961733.1 carbohydrate ABC transporter permease [Paenibacillus lignilyticus]MBP3963596.1 carbohydrate ABC transporter permease [Paenibacillus lignilyticus]SFS55568.1 ABC-type glycerol-3-phosphate transport system, permease component [Paenibacillus sp. BC26]